MPTYRLKELISEVISGEWGQEPSGEFSGVKVIRTTNFSNTGRLDLHKELVKRQIEPEKVEKKKLLVGDIIIEKSGGSPEQPVGRVVFFEETDIYLCNNFTSILRPNTKLVEPKYLMYLMFNLHRTRKVLKFQNKTTGIINLKLEQYLQQTEVVIPSKEIQRKLVKVFDKTFDLINQRQSQITALDELTQSVFLEMFGDPESNKNNYPVKSIMEFYENAKDAVKCGPFGSALKKNEYVQDGVPVWNMDNITKNNEFIDEPSLFVTQEKADELQGYNVRNGDIIISRAGTVGKMCVVDSRNENSLISTNLIRLRLNSKLKPEFLVWLIRIFGDRVCRMRTGNDGAFTHMNTSVLNSIEFPYPPLTEQEKFLVILRKLRKNREKLFRGLYEMEILYKSLVQKAFKGELFQEQKLNEIVLQRS